MEVILQAKGVVKRFRGVTVLNRVSVELRRGDVKLLIGPNGSGKTTLLRCLNLLYLPDEGEIYLDGTLISKPGFKVEIVRQKVGLIFQEAYLFNHMTVLENVAVGLKVVRKYQRSRAEAVAKENLDLVGIGAEFWNRYPSQLSGGQRQRVAIARTLAMEPDVVLFDEPTASLDPLGASEVIAVIKDLARAGVTSLIATQDVRLIAKLPVEAYLLSSGKLVFNGRIDELVNGSLSHFSGVTRSFVQALASDLRVLGVDAF
ncbi:MAG: ATP-binding cassette domain-containing protein [Thermofilaceae archaeon]|nr:ATP-binding cassette domain-containing protein [Thermofilaceae archaeon]MCX8179886.1 ATP-binding cassette domain-containing protein [Thermofilaceae archaeon]MDW8004429.1 ATP-binding cassette domain-containing protein [Thermofilaceae archaeon]